MYGTTDNNEETKPDTIKADDIHTHTTVLRLCGICPGQPG